MVIPFSDSMDYPTLKRIWNGRFIQVQMLLLQFMKIERGFLSDLWYLPTGVAQEINILNSSKATEETDISYIKSLEG